MQNCSKESHGEIYAKLQQREPWRDNWDFRIYEGDSAIVRYRLSVNNSTISVDSSTNEIPQRSWVVNCADDNPIVFWTYTIAEIVDKDGRRTFNAFPEEAKNPLEFKSTCAGDLRDISGRISKMYR